MRIFVFIGTLWCLHKAPTSDPTWKKLVVGLAAAYMLGDFFFIQGNRINDPTTLMMAVIVACMMAVVAIDARMPRSLLGSLLLGLLAGFATTFVSSTWVMSQSPWGPQYCSAAGATTPAAFSFMHWLSPALSVPIAI